MNFGLLIPELKIWITIVYWLLKKEIKLNMGAHTHTRTRTYTHKHTHTCQHEGSRGGPKPGQLVSQPKRREPRGHTAFPAHTPPCSWWAWRAPTTSAAGSQGSGLERWGETAPFATWDMRTWHVGAKGGLTAWGCVWQDCLPAGRSHYPLWSRWSQLPMMTCYRACERSEHAGLASWAWLCPDHSVPSVWHQAFSQPNLSHLTGTSWILSKQLSVYSTQTLCVGDTKRSILQDVDSSLPIFLFWHHHFITSSCLLWMPYPFFHLPSLERGTGPLPHTLASAYQILPFLQGPTQMFLFCQEASPNSPHLSDSTYYVFIFLSLLVEFNFMLYCLVSWIVLSACMYMFTRL